ncbi:MAG: 23S rRNA (adenine(2503)-C(2))-methyltransferase RlmN, partial [Betaproteobacteria bacterium]
MTKCRINVKTLSLGELQAKLVDIGLKTYRAGQILKWIYTHRSVSFDGMTNIAKVERGLLATIFTISSPSIIRTEVSKDGTRKFLFELEDRHNVESVLIPDEDRQTLCISSQVGCRQACRF